MKYAQRVERINDQGSNAWQVHSEAHAARGRGEDVVVMSIGDPDFATPAPISEAAMAALRDGDTHYTSCAGRPALRAAIAAGHQTRTGIATNADQVITLAGAQCGIYATLQCLCDPGDEIIVPEPGYVTYSAAIGSTGARMVPTPTLRDGSFRPDLQAMADAVTSNTKAIMFASPNNPSGIVFNRAEMQAIADLANQHDLWVICDAVYADLIFDGQYVAIDDLPGMRGRTITISSVSKSHAMTGWRVGWVIGPVQLAQHLEDLALCMLYGLPGFVQQGALHALTSCDDEMRRMRDTYRHRRDLVVNALRQSIDEHFCLSPQAGMFTLLDVRRTGMSGAAFCRALYDREKVSLIDASTFGTSAQGYARLSFTMDDQALSEGCRRIVRFVTNHTQ